MGSAKLWFLKASSVAPLQNQCKVVQSRAIWCKPWRRRGAFGSNADGCSGEEQNRGLRHKRGCSGWGRLIFITPTFVDAAGKRLHN